MTAPATLSRRPVRLRGLSWVELVDGLNAAGACVEAGDTDFEQVLADYVDEALRRIGGGQ